jgi:hypothetical protein
METVRTIGLILIGIIIGVVGGMYIEQQYVFHHPNEFCNVRTNK